MASMDHPGMRHSFEHDHRAMRTEIFHELNFDPRQGRPQSAAPVYRSKLANIFGARVTEPGQPLGPGSSGFLATENGSTLMTPRSAVAGMQLATQPSPNSPRFERPMSSRAPTRQAAATTPRGGYSSLGAVSVHLRSPRAAATAAAAARAGSVPSAAARSAQLRREAEMRALSEQSQNRITRNQQREQMKKLMRSVANEREEVPISDLLLTAELANVPLSDAQKQLLFTTPCACHCARMPRTMDHAQATHRRLRLAQSTHLAPPCRPQLWRLRASADGGGAIVSRAAMPDANAYASTWEPNSPRSQYGLECTPRSVKWRQFHAALEHSRLQTADGVDAALRHYASKEARMIADAKRRDDEAKELARSRAEATGKPTESMKGISDDQLRMVHKIVKSRLSTQFNDLRSTFLAFDRDHSGNISASECTDALMSLNVGVPRKWIDHLVNIADYDRDGEINYSEFARILTCDDIVSIKKAGAEEEGLVVKKDAFWKPGITMAEMKSAQSKINDMLHEAASRGLSRCDRERALFVSSESLRVCVLFAPLAARRNDQDVPLAAGAAPAHFQPQLVDRHPSRGHRGADWLGERAPPNVSVSLSSCRSRSLTRRLRVPTRAPRAHGLTATPPTPRPRAQMDEDGSDNISFGEFARVVSSDDVLHMSDDLTKGDHVPPPKKPPPKKLTKREKRLQMKRDLGMA
jgi:hypothetical protein